MLELDFEILHHHPNPDIDDMLHGEPPVDLADLADADYDAADVALGPEGEQTTDTMKKEKQ